MLIILGALATALTQWLKGKFNTSGSSTVFLVAGISLILAGIYTALVQFGYWEAFASILVLSGAIYTFIVQRFETPSNTAA